MIFKNYKNVPIPMDFGKTFPVSNFWKPAPSRHYSNDAKEADILGRLGLPLNGD